MRRRVVLVVMALVALTLCGCLQRRMFWSPDGQRAAVIGRDGLRLCDVNGKLTDPITTDVSLVAWLPDSRHFLAVRDVPAKTWEEASAAMSPARREAVLKYAEPLRAEILAYTGKWEEFQPKSTADLTGGEQVALLLYLRDRRREGLPEKAGAKWKDVEGMKAIIYIVQQYEATETGAEAGPVLTRGLEELAELRPSRDGKVIACVRQLANERLELAVLPATGGELRPVADRVARYPDWSADDRSLTYATTDARPEGSESIQLGSLTHRQVRSESGAILQEFGKAEEGVGVVFWPTMKIRCPRDGRVIFSGVEVTLPAAKDDMPQNLTLFVIDPGRRATVARLVPRATEAKLPKGLSDADWEVSPDEKRIVVGGEGDVAVLKIATGELEWAVTETGWKPAGMPEWRTSEELSVFVPPGSKLGSKDRQEVALWSGGEKSRCLSCGWPVIFSEQEQKQDAASKPASGAGE